MQNNPVITNGVSVSATIILVKTIISLGQVMLWWNLNDEQTAAWLTFVEVSIPILVVWIGTWLVKRSTTPLSRPIDEDGAPLTRPDNSPAIGEIRAAQTEAIHMNQSKEPVQ